MEIQATEYVKRNGAIVLRKALPVWDEESWQSLWKKMYGTLQGFPYYELYGVEPLLRLTIDELQNVVKYCKENPECSVEDALDALEIEAFYDEYGT